MSGIAQNSLEILILKYMKRSIVYYKNSWAIVLDTHIHYIYIHCVCQVLI